MRSPRIVIVILAVTAGWLLSSLAPAAAPPAAPAPQPEKPAAGNKGRTGSYQCTTSHAGYNYYVCVPKGYSDESPAGLHLYFHGQGSGGSAPNFGQWAKHFLEPFNLSRRGDRRQLEGHRRQG